MGKAIQREIYFSKHIKDQPTAEAYLNALLKSPYKTHQRIAHGLLGQYKSLKAQVENLQPPEEKGE